MYNVEEEEKHLVNFIKSDIHWNYATPPFAKCILGIYLGGQVVTKQGKDR